MKKLLSILLTLALTLSLSAPALAIHEGEIGICLDGRTYYPTSLPVQVQNGRTMVPLRDLAEKLGADVEWVQEKQEIVMTRAGSTVTMTLGLSLIHILFLQVQVGIGRRRAGQHQLHQVPVILSPHLLGDRQTAGL